MSIEMTFRQKLIRITSSAAICGLSFSFLLGETVDGQAKNLRSWILDPSIFPVEFLPISPSIALSEKLKSSMWRDELLALNSLQAPSRPPVLAPSATERPTTILASTRSDRVQIENSAFEKERKTGRRGGARKNAEEVVGPKHADGPKASEVEALLGAIHDATSRLSVTSTVVLGQDLPTVSRETAPKGSKSAEATAPSLMAFAQKDNALPARLASLRGRMVSSGWLIEGKILLSTAVPIERGHFEVGLFSKVDPESKPVGYPLPQQILPAGQTAFRLSIPDKIERGYLFAEFVAERSGKRTLVAGPTNPIERGPKKYAELFYRAEDSVSLVAAAQSKELSRDVLSVRGVVTTLFVDGRPPIPQPDVVVRVRGRKEAARTDREGKFELQIAKMKGTLFLEVLKAGYHPSIVAINPERVGDLKIEIASRHAIDQISQRLSAVQGSSRGVFLGRATASDGTSLRGLTAQLSLKADGPFYFNDEGVPTREARSTGADGRFIFLNVEPGIGYLETSLGGESIAPVQVSSVDGGELIYKDLTPQSGSIKGRIFNPVADAGGLQPIGGAKVRVDGASDWVTSDSFGAFSIGPLKWMRGERVLIEVSAERFFNHRYLVDTERRSSGLNLYAFPAAYLNRLARSVDLDLDPYAGLILGKISGPGLRLDALAEHSPTNNARDFYFDARGKLRGSHEMTDPRFGTYIIFNIPKGRALLQGSDADGVLKYSEAVNINPSSVSIQMD